MEIKNNKMLFNSRDWVLINFILIVICSFDV